MRFNRKIFIMFIMCFIVSFLLNYFVIGSDMDEVWNYGFSYNISKGLVPYKDFNMIVTPLFSFISSFFILIFGNYLYSLHILSALCFSIIFIIGYERIQNKIFILYPVILLVSYPSYNFFCIFLYFVLIYFMNSKFKYRDLLCFFIVSLMFLTKQTIGICLLIPLIFYSKSRIKGFICFITPIILFFLYLVVNHSFYQFFDYCFLGMFDFTGGNGEFFSLLFFVELIIVVYCLYKLIKSKFSDRELFFVLMFQIMSVPLFDLQHIFFSVIPFLYYLFNNRMSRNQFIIILILLYFLSIFIIVNSGDNKYYLVEDKNSFLYCRRLYIDKKTYKSYLNIIDYILEKSNKYKIYILSSNAYLFRLLSNQDITKYDLVNKGNMGYKGSYKYVSEINDYCSKNKCMFLLNNAEFVINQTDAVITKNILDNYQKKEEIKYFSVYVN